MRGSVTHMHGLTEHLGSGATHMYPTKNFSSPCAN